MKIIECQKCEGEGGIIKGYKAIVCPCCEGDGAIELDQDEYEDYQEYKREKAAGLLE